MSSLGIKYFHLFKLQSFLLDNKFMRGLNITELAAIIAALSLSIIAWDFVRPTKKDICIDYFANVDRKFGKGEIKAFHEKYADKLDINRDMWWDKSSYQYYVEPLSKQIEKLCIYIAI